jgi:hypothetical protein
MISKGFGGIIACAVTVWLAVITCEGTPFVRSLHLFVKSFACGFISVFANTSVKNIF